MSAKTYDFENFWQEVIDPSITDPNVDKVALKKKCRDAWNKGEKLKTPVYFLSMLVKRQVST